YVGVKLQRKASPIPEGLHLEHVAFGQQLGATRQPEALAVPLIDLLGPVAAQREPRRRRPDRIIADLGLTLRMGKHLGTEGAREHLRAEADAEERLILVQ